MASKTNHECAHKEVDRNVPRTMIPSGLFSAVEVCKNCGMFRVLAIQGSRWIEGPYKPKTKE